MHCTVFAIEAKGAFHISCFNVGAGEGSATFLIFLIINIVTFTLFFLCISLQYRFIMQTPSISHLEYKKFSLCSEKLQ